MKTTTKLGLGAVAACGVCCAPIIAPFILGIGGLGMFGTGFWIIGGLLVLAALIFRVWPLFSKTPGRNT